MVERSYLPATMKVEVWQKGHAGDRRYGASGQLPDTAFQRVRALNAAMAQG